MSEQLSKDKFHQDIKMVGLRAQATAAGLVQLCRELQVSGALNEQAVGRIKSAIADEITLTAPRSAIKPEFRREVCRRLDAIFAGEERLGDANDLPVEPEILG